jgi:UDP-glucose 4-epimerase
MRVLITGGAGFIGSHLAERYLADGWKVVVLDDFSTGTRKNLEQLCSEPNFSCIAGSVTDAGALGHAVRECDLVYHLASVVGVHAVMQSSVKTLETNINGTVELLRAVPPGTRVIITSTSEVYGKSCGLQSREDDPIALPSCTGRWSYACSKAAQEALGLAYMREQGIPVTIVRLFNTIGPRQSGLYGMVVPRFVKQALAGAPITVYGTGDQRRCFTYVGDVVEMLYCLGFSPNAAGEIINLGNNSEISINGLAQLVRTVAESWSDIVHIDPEAVYGVEFDEPFRRLPCLEKMHRLLGSLPATPLAKAIETVVEYERKSIGSPARFASVSESNPYA